MRDTRLCMGMPITVVIVSGSAEALEAVFTYFQEVDERFSTYKETSEISQINRKELSPEEWSSEMQEIMALAEQTKQETFGYFDIKTPDGSLDPSGVVKGWAIQKAAGLLKNLGFADFFIDAGGDIQTSGKSEEGEAWSVGIRNPFEQMQIVKVIYPHGRGVATSGTYVRGQHIYNPKNPEGKPTDVVSLTVIGSTILDADRFATAAFAMGRDGIAFIESLAGYEGYSIDTQGIATMTSGFPQYMS